MKYGGLSLAFLAMLAAPAMGQSLQDDFNAAQAAYDASDMVTAAQRFEALLKRVPPRNQSPTNKATAVIRLRLGLARLATGDTERALEALQASLPGLPAATTEEKRDVALVHRDIGRAHELLGDFESARAAHQRAIALSAAQPGTAEAFSLQVALARASVFDQPDLARRTLDEALPEAERRLLSGERKTDRDILGDIYSLRGRVELNAGQHQAAMAWFEKALKTAGGLGEKVTVSDVRIRSDLAIASYLLGRKDEVRRYLVYTGAGRLESDVGYADVMALPACGARTGIRPDDMAIVEFAITSVGRVTGVMPVYASRPAIAAAFARAVSGWSWAPEQVARMDPFWRASIRLELRCSEDVTLPALSSSFDAATDAWFASKGLQPVAVGSRSKDAALSYLRGELRRRAAQHGEESPQLLPVLSQMLRQGLEPDDWQKTAPRIWSLMTAAGAPADVRVVAEIGKRNADIMKELPKKATPVERLAAYRNRLAELLADLKRRGEDGGRAGAFVRAELAATYGTTGFAEAQQLYGEVLAAPPSQLPEHDPIRKAVKAQLAALEDVRSRAGNQAVPCALADPVPLPVNERIGSEAFPQEALFWGFAGWAKVAYDVEAQGRPRNVRTVMAYPPFIFGPATEEAIARFRYKALPASAGTIGCSGMTKRVRYVLP